MQIFNVPWKWTIPNVLSLLRLALIPTFAVLYLCGLDYWAFGVLALSGVTDMLDGFLARHLNQITECGKLLDPLADKLTQVAVVICVTTRYPEVLPLTVICFSKELCQGIGGLIMLRHRSEIRCAKWFGKLSTAVFYVCMSVLVLWHDELIEKARWVPIALVLIACVALLCAFIGYLRLFIRIRRAEGSSADNAAETNEG